VVAVDEDGTPGARHASLAEDGGGAARLQHAGFEAASGHVARQPLAAGAYTLGLLAHALEAEKVHEAGHEIAATLREPAVEGGPVELGWGHGAEDTRILAEEVESPR